MLLAQRRGHKYKNKHEYISTSSQTYNTITQTKQKKNDTRDVRVVTQHSRTFKRNKIF